MLPGRAHRTRTILLIFSLCSALTAENLEKTQKKALEAEVKTMTAEAERLQKSEQTGRCPH
jgi:hypothetical protein